MNANCSYLLFFFWFACIISMQVLLFKNGFLLTRVSQLQNATCTRNLQCLDAACDKTPAISLGEHVDTAAKTCIQQKSKAIVLLIDAFRHDFATYNDSNRTPEPYQNKMIVIDSLLREQPDNSRLFVFVADPPTTTMQRLKGLTTGSLPTFIDAGSNFASHEINEDNILDQLLNLNYNTIFMGDDTWTGLYPNRFLRSYPFPSFNVWDLDTVDDGVLEYLYEEMKTKWKFLIGHFLGVDHCGHRYGPNHPEMSRKLKQMNDVLKNVINQMDEETVLYVIGDHGMTNTGDHGGESKNEINAALFAYSKRPFSRSYFAHNNTVKQVDLVPTLATLLGVPIPHSNLGSLIHDCIPKDQHSWENAVLAAWANVQQLQHYIEEYAKTSQLFTGEKLRQITKSYMELKNKFVHVESEEDAEKFARQANDFIVSTRQQCEQIWIQFDAFSMARGLLLISTLTIFAYLLIEGIPDPYTIINKHLIVACYTSSLISILVSYALYCFNIVPDFLNAAYFGIGLSALVVFAVLTVRNFQEISSELYECSKTRSFIDIINRIILAFSALMLLSNSFILEESKVTLFFLLTLIIVQLVQHIINKMKNKHFTFKSLTKNKMLLIVLIMCVMIRISMNYWRCREEQGCNNSIFLTPKITGGGKEWALATATCVIYFLLCTKWLKMCGNLNGSSLSVIASTFIPISAAVCTAGFWLLHSLPAATKDTLLGSAYSENYIAWGLYVFIFFGILTIIIQPLCIFHLNDKTNRLEVDSGAIIPQLAKYVFANTKNNSPPVVYGLATVYSAAFLILSMYALLVWLLLLDYIVVPSCIALMLTLGLALGINAIQKFENCRRVEELFEVPPTSIMFWYIMGIYMFYATGHQPAFPNIAWEAALVGTVKEGGALLNTVLPAALVIINTFGSYLLVGLNLPLIVIAPFTLYVMVPSMINRSKIALNRGELEMLDHSKLVVDNVFKLCCKYVMCHILRVFAIMLAATIHCRHLMVWNIFAPKLIFEAIALFITLAAVFVSLAFFMHIGCRLDEFIYKLNKQST